jgi:hypothetical protein
MLRRLPAAEVGTSAAEMTTLAAAAAHAEGRVRQPAAVEVHAVKGHAGKLKGIEAGGVEVGAAAAGSREVGSAEVGALEVAVEAILEAAVSWRHLGAERGEPLEFHVELWSAEPADGGAVVQRIPVEGTIRATVPPADFERFMWNA